MPTPSLFYFCATSCNTFHRETLKMQSLITKKENCCFSLLYKTWPVHLHCPCQSRVQNWASVSLKMSGTKCAKLPPHYEHSFTLCWRICHCLSKRRKKTSCTTDNIQSWKRDWYSLNSHSSDTWPNWILTKIRASSICDANMNGLWNMLVNSLVNLRGAYWVRQPYSVALVGLHTEKLVVFSRARTSPAVCRSRH